MRKQIKDVHLYINMGLSTLVVIIINDHNYGSHWVRFTVKVIPSIAHHNKYKLPNVIVMRSSSLEYAENIEALVKTTYHYYLGAVNLYGSIEPRFLKEISPDTLLTLDPYFMHYVHLHNNYLYDDINEFLQYFEKDLKDGHSNGNYVSRRLRKQVQQVSSLT